LHLKITVYSKFLKFIIFTLIYLNLLEFAKLKNIQHIIDIAASIYNNIGEVGDMSLICLPDVDGSEKKVKLLISSQYY
jgi:hypothetical protein